MITIWRIENEFGKGAYNHPNVFNACRTGQIGDHPTPDRDELLAGVIIQEKHRFAFASINQLKNWFPEEKWNLFDVPSSRNEWYINEYVFPRSAVIIGKSQCIFDSTVTPISKRIFRILNRGRLSEEEEHTYARSANR